MLRVAVGARVSRGAHRFYELSEVSVIGLGLGLRAGLGVGAGVGAGLGVSPP